MQSVNSVERDYTEIVRDIEKYIDLKKQKETKIKATVEDVDVNNSILTVKLAALTDDMHIGSLVRISTDKFFKNYSEADVYDIEERTVKLEVKGSISRYDGEKIIIDTSGINVILERLAKVTDRINNGEVSEEAYKILGYVSHEGEPRYREEKTDFTRKRLNKSQRDAVKKSIGARDFHLVVGPPGTGKTFVIEEMVDQFLNRKQKTLVTAWSNIAVDNIVKRLSEEAAGNTVRIGPEDSVDTEVKKYSIFRLMRDHKDWKIVKDLYESTSVMKIRMKEIDKSMARIQKEINFLKSESGKIQDRIKSLEKESEKHKAVINEISENKQSSEGPVENKMKEMSEKTQVLILLSKDILKTRELEKNLPGKGYVEQLKRDMGNLHVRILKKKPLSLFSSKKRREIDELQDDLDEKSEELENIEKIESEYRYLKDFCKDKIESLYPEGNARPDKNALEEEHRILKTLEEEYFPDLKDQIQSGLDKKLENVYRDAYTSCLKNTDQKHRVMASKNAAIRFKMHEKISSLRRLRTEYNNLHNTCELYEAKIIKIKREIIEDIVSKAGIIAATAVSSCHSFLDNTKFDVTVMDEASQVSSFMSLLPLLKTEKFILVGDNKQLQPIEEDGIPDYLNKSIFNRLTDFYPEDSTFLDVQYRMRPSIAEIANRVFYGGRLKTGRKDNLLVKFETEPNGGLLDFEKPAVFADTSKSKYYEDGVGGKSCLNTKEAKFVVSLIDSYLDSGIEASCISVVTPYVKQKMRIRELLEEKGVDGIEVDTVHQFQGREKEIVIVSFAKSKSYVNPRTLKFVGNQTLVNVAITRAKDKLIVVGNSDTLSKNVTLGNVFKEIGRENTKLI